MEARIGGAAGQGNSREKMQQKREGMCAFAACVTLPQMQSSHIEHTQGDDARGHQSSRQEADYYLVGDYDNHYLR